ncbi:TonB-dependent receptor [Pseudofulvibacter geojedonensis]|uniref:TonB-dependent receptor domain-containing protein n=1 Tax=Pseudofulvibacter geojedonensis TaxID=1123758 RepID=A0ABW3I2F3_9FLAO
MIKKIMISFLLLLLSQYIIAQEVVVIGKVVTKSNEPLIGASLVINSYGAVTDFEGNYKLKIPQGNYILKCSFLGYNEEQKIIDATGKKQLLVNFTLIENSTNLNSITIVGKSEVKKLEDSPQQVAIIKAKKYHNKATSTNDILNKESGINIRQDGGMGGNSNISINGLQGKQIKIFIDDIPVDFLGYGYGVNLLPSNFISRIEVYKGVVPIHLGADALGGGINVITRKQKRNNMEVSYSHGSFNTHQASLNAQKVVEKSGLILGVNAFFNYSDNNYKVDVTVPDESYNPQNITVRRFHDTFKQGLIKTKASLVNKKWADLLSVSLAHQRLYDEIQHNAIMSQPYGEAYGTNNSTNASIRHKWSNNNKKFFTDAFLGYNHINTKFNDTTLNVYTWDGKVFTQRSYGGEITTSQSTLETQANVSFGRVNLKYIFNKNSQLNFSSLVSNYERDGKDATAANFYGYDPFKNKASRFKTVSGLSYQYRFWNQKITSITALKHYYYQSKGFDNDAQNGTVTDLKQNGNYNGVSQAFSIQALRKLLIKTSYEYATRLPDEYELFGDFILIDQNANLTPEISHNINALVKWEEPDWMLGINGFFRDIDDIIFLKTTQFQAQYQNLLKARAIGFELFGSYQPFKSIELNGNLTYQDIRNRSSQENSNTVNPKYFNARLPNRPYFFANHEVNFKTPINREKDQLSFWWSGRYVKDFYLNWEVDGLEETKPTIPSQWVQNVGVSYLCYNKQFTLTLESQNVTNEKAFDNFNVQRPGRAFFFKMNYTFNNL